MTGDPATFHSRLLDWYDRHQRKLPWRQPAANGAAEGVEAGRPEPYHVFVSEAMLQQTQVATVIPYFNRFIERLPTFDALAAADEQEVLRLWQGLGYYSRARNLHATAKIVARDLAGQLPRNVDDLLGLRGIGRYTAGAIASIAFNQRAPILDGNVARVLCRIDRIHHDPRQPRTRAQLWRRAEAILPDRRTGDFNSALMELGATVCTPRAPKCLLCPVREQCEAFAAGVQATIPPPRAAKTRPLIKRWTFCIHDRAGRWLIEQRPPSGRWAGLWQFVTIEPQAKPPTAASLAKSPGVSVSRPKAMGAVEHGLTHRRYEFDVFVCNVRGEASDCSAERQRKWVALDALGDYPLPRPHLKIAAMLREMATV